MNFGEFMDGKPQQPLPEVLSSREVDLNAFQTYCNNLMLKILTLFAIGLNVRPSAIIPFWETPKLKSSDIFRSILVLAAETGSPLDTAVGLAAALSASSNIRPSPQTSTSTPQSISAVAHTQITAL